MNENTNASIAFSSDYARACNLAERALADCRTSLMMAYRFMDIALWKMPFYATQSSQTLLTDGKVIAYDPLAVLQRYRDSSTELVRDLLHSIIHCVFRQPFDRSHPNQRIWMISCDVVCEAIAMEMASKRFPSPLDEERQDAIRFIRRSTSTITPNKLYAVLVEAYEDADASPYGLNRSYISKLGKLFARDGHVLWPAYTDIEDENVGDALANQPGIHATASSSAKNTNEEIFQPSEELLEDLTETIEGDSGELDELADDLVDLLENKDLEPSNEEEGASDEAVAKHAERDEVDELDKEWMDISKLIETDLMTYAHEWGDGAGNLMANLAVANRNRVDFRDFLRRFCSMGEDIRINDDEFDYVFYTYGLKLFGNMPLVEPLEYQEAYRVREFVIAIDTSGSCEGELVQAFLNATYEILSNSEGFGEKVNIHIVQCDAQIQHDTKIESVDQIEEYKDHLIVRGFGGTDFRPVFDYVDQLIFEGEFTDLKGLIYFTDGYGTFPGKRPPYDTAFVFVEEDGEARKVPPWAMKVIIGKESLRTMQ